MYLTMILLFMAILPIGSIVVEFLMTSAHPMALVGKWFVFWGVGVRLVLAGLRQLIQPSYTSRQIFRIESDDPLPFVQELGSANLSMGTTAVLSLLFPNFTLPLAVVGGIFYGIAGLRHVMDSDKPRTQTIAMVSDLFIAAVLGAFIISRL